MVLCYFYVITESCFTGHLEQLQTPRTSTSVSKIPLDNIEHQWQWPMPVNGYTLEWVWDQFSSLTIDEHWPLPLTLSVFVA